MEYFWDRANATRMGDYLTRVEGEFIAESLACYPEVQTILDIGGGSGRFARPLTRQGYHVLVTEVDPIPLQKLRHSASEVTSVLMSGATHELGIADASVDCVLCMEVFALIDGSDTFFSECQRILRPGGLLIITTHNKYSYKALLKHIKERDSSFYRAKLSDTRKRLHGSGFAIVKERGCNWVPAMRTSNSSLVTIADHVERLLNLQSQWAAGMSPWVLMLAQKQQPSRFSG